MDDYYNRKFKTLGGDIKSLLIITLITVLTLILLSIIL